jgi:hypothetical protein
MEYVIKVVSSNGTGGTEWDVLDTAQLFVLALDGSGWSTPRPGHFIPGKEPHDALWVPYPV